MTLYDMDKINEAYKFLEVIKRNYPENDKNTIDKRIYIIEGKLEYIVKH